MVMVYCLTVFMTIRASSVFAFGRCHHAVYNQGVISVLVPEYSQHINRPNLLVEADQQNHTRTLPGLFSQNLTRIQVSEQQLLAFFLQHKQLSRKICIKYRKADGIFPFHYFW